VPISRVVAVRARKSRCFIGGLAPDRIGTLWTVSAGSDCLGEKGATDPLAPPPTATNASELFAFANDRLPRPVPRRTVGAPGCGCPASLPLWCRLHHLSALLLRGGQALPHLADLPYLVLKEGKTPLLLVPAAIFLALFAWLLTLHPTAAGRVYAAYGAVYVSVALVWLRVVDGVPLTLRDLVGVVVVLAGMGVPMGGGRRS